MEIIKTTDPAEFERYAEECLAGHEGLVAHYCETPCIWTGQLPTLDLAECGRRGLFVGVGRYLGGSIVNMPGDLSLCLTTWGKSDFGERVVGEAAEWLSIEKGLTVTRDENDVLVDGKKVVSWARATTVEGWCQTVVHFSIGPMDLDLVQAICTKPTEKTPGALSEYGVTAAELWAMIEREVLRE